MKAKLLKLIPVFLLAALCVTGIAYALTGTIDAVDSSGTEQTNFLVSENVYVDGTCVPAEDQTVDIYVVADQSTWTDGDPLTDVTGSPISVTADLTGAIPLTMIWSNPLTPGDYDVVVDVNTNGLYDSFETCVDDITPAGFTVDEPIGAGYVSAGASNPGDHNWILGGGDPNNEMLQFDINIDSTEDVDIDSFSLDADGTGNDVNGLNAVFIVEDLDGDGVYDTDTESIWGSGSYTADNGTLDISVSETIDAGDTVTIIVVYVMNGNSNDGDTYSFSLTDIGVTGVDTSADITLDNLPMDSGVKTIVLPSEEPCSLDIQLSLTPSTVNVVGPVKATISGFTNCAGETAFVTENSCSGEVVGSCAVGDEGCNFNFTASDTEGSYGYFACFDLNEDSDFDDAGEQDSATLKVQLLEESGIASPFEDIDGHWAEEFIDDLRLKGIISGKSEGVFDPDAAITRAELTKIALNAFEYEVPETVSEKPFPDVELEDWFVTFVTKAKDTGVVDGYDDGTFKPNQVVNRVEALKILLEAAGAGISSAPEASFPDTDPDAWYAEYLNYAIENGLVSGYSTGELEGLFGPARSITRAEVAKIVSKLLAL